MSSSIIPTLSLTIFISALLFFPNPTFSTDSPQSSPYPSPSPSPSPQLTDSPQSSPSPSPQLPPATAPSPAFLRSPPAPPPSVVPAPDSPSPSPVAADGVHVADLDSEDGSGGMSGGKKAGIAFGVIAGGCVVGVAAMLYKKRQNNIRRGQYGYTARGDYP